MYVLSIKLQMPRVLFGTGILLLSSKANMQATNKTVLSSTKMIGPGEISLVMYVCFLVAIVFSYP